jgi:hypothetical protein
VDAAEREQRRERLLVALIEAAAPLKDGPDPELTLELLVEAAGLFKERLEQELAELRQEQVE